LQSSLFILDVVTSYINDLLSQLKGGSTDEPEIDVMEEDEESSAEPPFPPLFESGEDYDKAGNLKQEAAELSAAGDWEGALEKYTGAVLAAPPSALLYANRATALLKLDRPRAAERDCNEALKENPDSAKALRVRGKARKALGQWEAALHDLSASQQIDFDEGTVEDLKFLTEKHIEQERAEAAERID
jgi:suppressor of tumorigenicity protein 13